PRRFASFLRLSTDASAWFFSSLFRSLPFYHAVCLVFYGVSINFTVQYGYCMEEERTVLLTRQTRETYGQEYDKHLFEQYKLYVEMADRVSSRRMLANSFFVGVHTALIAAFAVLLKERILTPTLVGTVPFVSVLLLCFLWWRIVASYRQLNSGKFKVIHEIEQLLPLAPYKAEWKILGEGKNLKRYRPITHVENWVPLCFGLLYILLGIALFVKA
ncbi:MAG: hypothetical protein AB1374_11195, partial [Bacillota bacterium]